MVITMYDKFGKWWSNQESKTNQQKFEDFYSKSHIEQDNLKQSFVNNGWCQLFCQNYIDEALDFVNNVYGIDLYLYHIHNMLNHHKH